MGLKVLSVTERLRYTRLRIPGAVSTFHSDMARSSEPPPITPDGRYIVVRGRLWRKSNPHLAEEVR